jgi:hypothetical protein
MTNNIEKLTSSIENKLQFIITIFTIMVGAGILKGNTNTEFYFVISILLLDYILFSAIKDYNFKLTEFSLKLLNGSIIAGIAAYIVPFYTIAIQTQSSLHFGQGYFLIGTGAVSAFLMALFPIIFLVLLIIYWIKDNI